MICSAKSWMQNGLLIVKIKLVLEIDLNERYISRLAEDLPANGLITSEDQSVIAWGNGDSIYTSDRISVKNLTGGAASDIKAGVAEKLLPITFFGHDLVYGVARLQDISLDEKGHTRFPMYILNIRGENGKILKDYKQPGIYITDVEQKGDMINLKRMAYDENELLVSLPDDQILNNSSSISEKNVVETVA